MSKQVALAARNRLGNGKGEAKKLRREGRVPGIAYGTDLNPTPVSVDGRELYHALRTDAGLNAILRLNLDGDNHLALAREIQRHPVRREILHVDFVTVNRNVKVTVDVPVHLEGTPPGTDDGGVADQVLFTLPVEVLPLEVPDGFLLDVSDMQLGDVKRVADIRLPDGVTTLEDPERTVVSVSVPAMEAPADEETEVGDLLGEAAPTEADVTVEETEEGAGEES